MLSRQKMWSVLQYTLLQQLESKGSNSLTNWIRHNICFFAFKLENWEGQEKEDLQSAKGTRNDCRGIHTLWQPECHQSLQRKAWRRHVLSPRKLLLLSNSRSTRLDRQEPREVLNLWDLGRPLWQKYLLHSNGKNTNTRGSSRAEHLESVQHF